MKQRQGLFFSHLFACFKCLYFMCPPLMLVVLGARERELSELASP